MVAVHFFLRLDMDKIPDYSGSLSCLLPLVADNFFTSDGKRSFP